MLGGLLDLNDTQTGVLYGAFDFADDNGLLLLDLKDLRSLLNSMNENRKELSSEYGNLPPASLGCHSAQIAGAGRAGCGKFFW